MRPALKLAPAVIALALAPSLARAQVSPENAQALEQQIHDWLSGLVGPTVSIPDHPVTIAPEDDHYRVTLPLDDALTGLGLDATNATFTAEARPLPGDRWALDDIRIPNMKVQVPAGMPGGPVTWSMSIPDQHISAVFDPSLATASTFDADISGQTSTTEGQSGAHASAVEHYTAHSVWMPTGDGRVDILSTTDGEKMKASQIMPDGTPLNWSVGRMHGTLRIDGVAAASVLSIVHEVQDLAPMMTEAQQTGHLPPAGRQRAKALLTQIRNLLGGFQSEETLQDLHFESGGHGGSLSKLAIGLGGGADGGKLDFHIRLALDGIDSPDIPVGPLREYPADPCLDRSARLRRTSRGCHATADDGDRQRSAKPGCAAAAGAGAVAEIPGDGRDRSSRSRSGARAAARRRQRADRGAERDLGRRPDFDRRPRCADEAGHDRAGAEAGAAGADHDEGARAAAGGHDGLAYPLFRQQGDGERQRSVGDDSGDEVNIISIQQQNGRAKTPGLKPVF